MKALCPKCNRYFEDGNFENFNLRDNSVINCVCGAKIPIKQILELPEKLIPMGEMKGYLQKYEINEGDVVIDAGAYVGEFTLLASILVGSKGKVISFEPDPKNYGILSNNIKNYALSNVLVLNKGLWSEDKVLCLKMYDMASTFIDIDAPWPVADITVVSLDNELQRLGISKVDFIKMDIEGAEIEAIKGSKGILTNNNVKLAIASYHLLNNEKTHFRLEKLLPELGYSAETVFAGQLLTYASKKA